MSVHRENPSSNSPEKFVVYRRVSTKQQGSSGLGLQAQEEDVRAFLKDHHRVLSRFTEVESGKNSDRKELKEAIAYAKLTGATLLVAKLDRLARNTAFISTLMESGVNFCACDNPQATPFTIHILAAVAEHEAKMISERTSAALARTDKAIGRASSKYGTGTGSMDVEDREEALRAGAKKGGVKSAEVRKRRSQERRETLRGIVEPLSVAGHTLREIAEVLNSREIPAPRGGTWSTGQVARLT